MQIKNQKKSFPGENSVLGAKIVLILLLAATVGACSATSLQCGTDGDSSFVNLNTTPKVLSQNARNMADLCSFAYDEFQVQGVLKLEQ